jgi:hypothetical protein
VIAAEIRVLQQYLREAATHRLGFDGVDAPPDGIEACQAGDVA